MSELDAFVRPDRSPFSFDTLSPEWPLSWSTDIQVHDIFTLSNAYPALAYDSDRMLCVIWQDRREGNFSIYVARSEDGGRTWVSSGEKVNDSDHVNTLSTHDGDADVFPIVTSDDRLCLVWRDLFYEAWGDIYFDCSDDGGLHWGTDVKLNDDGVLNSQSTPRLALAPDGTLYAFWSDYRDGDYADIYVSKSVDGGTTWSANSRVNNITSHHQHDPAVAIDYGDGAIYVAWEDSRGDEWNIYVARSDDGGVTWTDGQRVNDDVGQPGRPQQRYPDIVVDQGHVYVIWKDYRHNRREIWFVSSTDRGDTWSTNLRLDNGFLSSYDDDDPRMALDDAGNIYVVWQGEYEIYLTYSQDGGQTWHRESRVNEVTTGYQRWPGVVTGSAGEVYVAWSDCRSDNCRDDDWNIHFARAERTEAWSVEAGPHGAVDQQLYSDFLTVGGEIFAVWQDYGNGNWDIYYAHSADGGATWGQAVRVNDDRGFSRQTDPRITRANDGTLHVTWTDYRHHSADIYMTTSTDNGATWSANVQVNDPNAFLVDQAGPSITVNPANADQVYIAWTDWRELSHTRVYFSASTDGGHTWLTDTKISGYRASNPEVAYNAGDGTLYVVAQEIRTGNQWDIYAHRSDDAGQTWTDGVKVSDGKNGQNQVDPTLVLGASGDLAVAWEDYRAYNYDIYFARSTDRGATWTANTRINHDTGTAWQYDPSVDVDGVGRIYVTWHDSRDGIYRAYLAYSTDNGSTWLPDPDQAVSDDTSTFHHLYTAVSVAGLDDVYVMWSAQVRGIGIYDGYLDHSVDGGRPGERICQ